VGKGRWGDGVIKTARRGATAIALADTLFGRAVATRKRELEASVDFMSREERERMIRKLNELNEEEEALATATGVEEEHHTGELGQMDGV
jgi:hypothetical protein